MKMKVKRRERREKRRERGAFFGIKKLKVS